MKYIRSFQAYLINEDIGIINKITTLYNEKVGRFLNIMTNKELRPLKQELTGYINSMQQLGHEMYLFREWSKINKDYKTYNNTKERKNLSPDQIKKIEDEIGKQEKRIAKFSEAKDNFWKTKEKIDPIATEKMIYFKKMTIIAYTLIAMSGLGGALRAFGVYLDMKWKKNVERDKYIVLDPSDPRWLGQEGIKKLKDAGINTDDLIDTKNDTYADNGNIIDVIQLAQDYPIYENAIVDTMAISHKDQNLKKLEKLLDTLNKDQTLVKLVLMIENSKTVSEAKPKMKKLYDYFIAKYGTTSKEKIISIAKNLPEILKNITKI